MEFLRLKKSDITSELLHSIFEYSDGEILWKRSANTRVRIGSVAGTLNKGYKRTIFNYLKLYNHQIIFFLFNGYFPDYIDHIDGDTLNNKIENLRAVTAAENCQNRKTPVSNRSGFKGVSFHKKTGKFQSEIQVSGKQIYLGLFNKSEEAALAYDKAAILHFGEYAKTNIITKHGN